MKNEFLIRCVGVTGVLYFGNQRLRKSVLGRLLKESEEKPMNAENYYSRGYDDAITLALNILFGRNRISYGGCH